MSTASWPLTGTFPQDFRSGCSIKPNSNTVETAMSTGYPKARRLDTVTFDEISGSIAIRNKADLAVLKDWFHSTIKDGAEEFEWHHPTTRETMMFRMIGPPLVTHVAGEIFDVSITVREVP